MKKMVLFVVFPTEKFSKLIYYLQLKTEFLTINVFIRDCICASMNAFICIFLHECIFVCIGVHNINTYSLKAKSQQPKYFNKAFFYQFFSLYFSGYISVFFLYIREFLNFKFQNFTVGFSNISLWFLSSDSPKTPRRDTQKISTSFFAKKCCFINTS